MRRIITVASGKGGVGKTTFAINFALALSRIAPTVLVDLDTGTSSIRNTLDVSIQRDLYHFFRRNTPLDQCLTTLDAHLDPEGLFENFALVAAPRHSIEEIATMGPDARRRLMEAINRLPATFTVLDLRAGLDATVIDFLPLSNSGILVFTPRHPAATLAAGDIVRSLLFRKLRIVFSETSPLFRGTEGHLQHRLVNDLLDQVEDVYQEGLPNLDAFLEDLHASLGDTEWVTAIEDVVHSFGVYFVLNMFNGVEESWENAIRPFGTHLKNTISDSLTMTNLGWIVEDPKVHDANCRRRPILLEASGEGSRLGDRTRDPVLMELDRLEADVLGLPSPRDLTAPPRSAPRDEIALLGRDDPLSGQLEVLRRMYRSRGTAQVRENFAYITRRAHHLLRDLPQGTFGQPRLVPPEEIQEHVFGRKPGYR